MQPVVNEQEEGVTGHISREFNSIIIQATPDYNISGSMFLPMTNRTLYKHGRPLSPHLYYLTSFSQKLTCANRKHQMVRLLITTGSSTWEQSCFVVQMPMPLAHSYFSLKAEYCDLENVFKSTAIFDHFYDLMLTCFFFFNVNILSKENSG